MNKLFIILLAIGLASAHTFVKRDAPVATVAEKNYIDTIKKEFEDLAGNVQKAFDPETLKKNFNDIVDKVTSAANNLKPKEKQ